MNPKNSKHGSKKSELESESDSKSDFLESGWTPNKLQHFEIPNGLQIGVFGLQIGVFELWIGVFALQKFNKYF